MPEFSYIILFIITGALVGIVSGMLGIGGGLVIVPVTASYLLALGVQENVMQIATATSLCVIFIATLTASYKYYKIQAIRLNYLVYLGPSAAIGSIFGRFFAVNMSSIILALVFVSFTIWNAIFLLLNSYKKNVITYEFPNRNILVAVGICIGVLSSTLGVGGGLLMVPFLVRYITITTDIVALSCFTGCIIALIGTISSIYSGYINLQVALIVALTSAITAPLGVKFAHFVPVNRLKQTFAVLLVLVSIAMLWQVSVTK